MKTHVPRRVTIPTAWSSPSLRESRLGNEAGVSTSQRPGASRIRAAANLSPPGTVNDTGWRRSLDPGWGTETGRKRRVRAVVREPARLDQQKSLRGEQPTVRCSRWTTSMLEPGASGSSELGGPDTGTTSGARTASNCGRTAGNHWPATDIPPRLQRNESVGSPRPSSATLLTTHGRLGLELADRKVRLAVLIADGVGPPLADSGKPGNAPVGGDHIARTVGVGHSRLRTASAECDRADDRREERSHGLRRHRIRRANARSPANAGTILAGREAPQPRDA